MSAFANSGQVCISLQRLYVHDTIADAFLERFVAATRALKIGNPLDRDCDVGPIISDDAADRAETWIRDALDEGGVPRRDGVHGAGARGGCCGRSSSRTRGPT